MDDTDNTEDYSHTFIVMWDCYGLEYVQDLTQISKEESWQILQGKEVRTQMPNIMHLTLRARMNTHRDYEIYTLQVSPGITEDDIREMFENDPQYSADLIRSRGTCLMGKYNDFKERKIR